MSIADVVRAKASGAEPGPTISFELFPPRSERAEATLHTTLTELADFGPDFFSVTYGTSGTTRTSSRAVVQQILARTKVPPVAHLTCVESSRAAMAEVIAGLLRDGVRDFLALRGDPPKGQVRWDPPRGAIATSAELVGFITSTCRLAVPHQSTSVTVAAHPTAWYEGRGDDLAALSSKEHAGAELAITQVVYHAEHYASFVATARDREVSMPILPGIIPLTDLKRLTRLESLTGVAIPEALRNDLESCDGERRWNRAVAATADLAEGLLEAGAPGIHLYTFNQHQPALAVLNELDRRGALPTRTSRLIRSTE